MLKLWLLGGGLLVGFANLGAARSWVRDFIRWYSHETGTAAAEVE